MSKKMLNITPALFQQITTQGVCQRKTVKFTPEQGISCVPADRLELSGQLGGAKEGKGHQLLKLTCISLRESIEVVLVLKGLNNQQFQPMSPLL